MGQVMRYGFPRHNRLTTHYAFSTVLRQSQSISFAGFKVFLKQNALPFSRLGIKLRKRLIKLAVDRNRLKRILREGFRHRKQALAGLDIVVMVCSSKFIGQDCIILKKEVHQLWQMLPGKKYVF